MKVILLLSILFSATFLIAQTVGINSTGAVPSTSAMLDVSATNKGLLVPRVNIIDLNTDVPVSSPVTSLLVYNTNATSGVGYYFWNGSKWVNLKDSDSNADEDWYEVGTTNTPNDINDAIFTNGNVGLGTTSPNAPLEISPTNISSIQEGIRLIDEGSGSSEGLWLQFGQLVTNDYSRIGGVSYNNTSGGLYFSTKADADASPIERVRIDVVGNVGVGLTNPTSKLHIVTPVVSSSGNVRIISGNSNGDVVDITGSNTEVYLDHFVGATFTATAPTALNQVATFKVDNAPILGANVTVTDNMALWVESGNSCFGGNVGVGLTNPTSKLHVVSNNIGDNVNDEQGLFTFQTSPTGSNFLFLDFKNRRHTAGNNWFGTNGRLQRRVDITAQGFIDFGIDGVSASSGLGFGTGGGGTPQTRMVIDNNGNVGIGTTTPNSLMHLDKAMVTGDVAQLKIENASGSALWLGQNHSLSNGYSFIKTHANEDLYFQVGQSTDNANPDVVFLSSGNVGIGTTTPTSKLQVVGIVEYSNNAAALAGGLTIGAFYRTGDVLKVVH